MGKQGDRQVGLMYRHLSVSSRDLVVYYSASFSISKQPKHASNSENLLNRQTWQRILYLLIVGRTSPFCTFEFYSISLC